MKGDFDRRKIKTGKKTGRLLALALSAAMLMQGNITGLAAGSADLPLSEDLSGNITYPSFGDDIEVFDGGAVDAEDLNDVALDDEGDPFVPGYRSLPWEYDMRSLSDEAGDIMMADADLPSANEASYITSELPPLRNQNPYGTCWAHSSMALMEISMLKQGIMTSPDFSELHLAYFMYNYNGSTQDPLKLTAGDTVELGWDRSTNKRLTDYMESGGNLSLSQYMLYNWVGAADESKVPYSSAESVKKSKLANSLAMDDVAHIKNVYRVNVRSDRNYAKALIKKYGALGISYYESNSYYDGTNNSYFNYNNKNQSNHAVTVVGWDDNFSKDKFNTGRSGAQKPAGNGAWLIRNSWKNGGTYENSRSHSGYFWISYYDVSLTSAAYAFECSASQDFDYNYHYDGGVGTSYYTTTNSGGIANVFTAQNPSGDEEVLDAVAFEVMAPNVKYTVEVYKDLPEYLPGYQYDIQGGTRVASVSGTATFEGIYQVSIPGEVFLAKDEKFAVTVIFEKANSDILLSLDGSLPQESKNNYWVWSTGVSEGGQSFVKFNGSRYWNTTGANGNVRVKAFTSNSAAETFTVTLKDTDGTVVKTLPVRTGGSVTLPGAAKKAGYTFKGWAGSDGKIYDAGASISSVKGDMELTASYSADVYDIEYVLEQGISVLDDSGKNIRITVRGSHDNPSSYTVETDNILLKNASPSKELESYNILFTGWYKNADRTGANVISIPRGTADGNMTLYAGWQQKPQDQHTLTLLDQNDNIVKVVFLNPRDRFVLPKTIDGMPDGYGISAWNIVDGAGNVSEEEGYQGYLPGDAVTGIKADMILKVAYEPVIYQISFETAQTLEVTYDNGRTGKVTADGSHENTVAEYSIEQEDITLLPVTPNEAAAGNFLKFVGWYDNPDRDGEPVASIKKGSFGDITLYAGYEQQGGFPHIAEYMVAAGQKETSAISGFYAEALAKATEIGQQKTMRLLVVNENYVTSKIASVSVNKTKKTATFTAKSFNKKYNSPDKVDRVMVIAQYKPKGSKVYLNLDVPEIAYTIYTPIIETLSPLTSTNDFEYRVGAVEDYIRNDEYLNPVSVTVPKNKYVTVEERDGKHYLKLFDNYDKYGNLLNPKSGSVKVTVQYGDGINAKNNAKYYLTVKLVLPKLAEKNTVSRTTNPAKPKYKTITISNLNASVIQSADDISVTGYEDYDLHVGDVTLAKNRKSASVKVWSTEKTVDYTIPLVFNVLGDNKAYVTNITVK